MTPPEPFPETPAWSSDRYTIERELGRGGMATVYLAHDMRHERPVALKVLRPELAASLGAERFLLEIRVTARLQHAHILPLLDSGVLESAPGRQLPFYAMPYVDGESLRDRLRRERQLPVGEAVRITAEAAAALDYAHRQGVVHRDVKPENILLSAGQAIVADFGIARAAAVAGGQRLTETGLALGTPYYMSPEQLTGEREVDARSDVYALGCVLYEMLVGEPPFTGPSAQAVAARALTQAAPPVRNSRPTVPAAIERVIARALAKLPADRFATAAEFGAALSQAGAAVPARFASSRTRWQWALAAGGLALCAAAVALFWGPRSSGIAGSASSVVVLPFTPSGADTALSRLGRDLVFTLSAELDGLGGIRVAEPHSVLAKMRPDDLAAADLPALARRFGAGSLIRGSLVRVGDAVRLDLAMISSQRAATALARATVTAPPDSVAVLTDSAVRALLVQIWSRGTPPTPSLDGALRTRSVPALRAFLQGEGEITAGQWEAAAVSYQRALEADSTFWLAYARHVYARHWSLHEPGDNVVALLQRHRAELPEREWLSTEAILLQQDSLLQSLERARAAAERYPDSWFGWLLYADNLLHFGPLLGHTMDEARTAFERAIDLNPGLIPAWEHLLLAGLRLGDTVATSRGFAALVRLDAGPTLDADGYGHRMLQFRFLRAIQRGDRALADSLTGPIARDSAPAAVPDGSYYDPYRFGWFVPQIRVSRAALAAPIPPARKQVNVLLLALSWAGRGAWDSALVNLDRLAASGTDSTAAVRAYGLAAVGHWLGALDLREVEARRRTAVRAPAGAEGQAEIGWLDGLVAAASGNRRALAEARGVVRRSGDPRWGALERSLAAMDLAARGDRGAAGRAMAGLEWEQAAVGGRDFGPHPFAVPVNRLAAARWLASAGDAERALRLLRWADAAFLLHSSTLYTLMLTPLVDLERARIETRLGRDDLAASHYAAFLSRYDQPVPHHAALVREARAWLDAHPSR